MIGRNIFLRILLVVIIQLSISDIRANENAMNSLLNCRKIENSEQRLNCFDKGVSRLLPPTYTGKLGFVTDPFHLKTSHILRFRSRGVIFVLYLRDSNGNVLQNLHIGGQGEDEFLIKEPGIYSLKIDGSAGWDIWLQPVEN